MRTGLSAAVLLSMCVIAPTLANAATRIDDPVKFVSALYAKIHDADKMKDSDIPEDIYTPHLAALFALDTKEAGGEIGRYDFVFWTNGQDWQLTNIKVVAQPVENTKDREVVVAKFDNTGTPEEIHLYFEKSKNGWLLDDARSASKTYPWTLSLLLKYGQD